MLADLDAPTKVDMSSSPRAIRLMHARAVGDTLRGYAERGAFRSFSEGTMRSAKLTYRMLWHYGRTYRVVLDLEAQSLAIPDMLPGVPAKSPMVGELRAFLKPFGTEQVPDHRRLDAAKGELKLMHYRQGLTLAVRVKDDEYVYCVRKLVHIAHEVFMVFLREGPYYDYRVEKLGLDPDVAWG